MLLTYHSDNGSEYFNYTVAKLLEKLRIEFTKSRPKKSNDKALAEGKNASIVRKTYGCYHNHAALNPYINYNSPCLYPALIIDKKGKQIKKYKYESMMTPYDKFKSLPKAEIYLKKNMTFKNQMTLLGQWLIISR